MRDQNASKIEHPDNSPPVDPALFEREDVRAVLAALDVGALYRLLGDAGINQRQIAP